MEGHDDHEWWSRERVLMVALFGATVIALYLCYLLVRPFLSSLAWALALAVIAHPLYKRIRQRISNPSVAAGIAVFIVAILIVGPTIFVIQQLVVQATETIEKLRAEAESGRLQKLIESNRWLAMAQRWAESRGSVEGGLEEAAKTVTSRASTLVTSSVWGTIQLLITFFVLFYFFRDWRASVASVRSLVPLTRQEADRVFARVVDTIQATVYGTLVVAALQGVLGGLGFWWLGLPAPLLWGLMMGLLAIVPILGAFVIWMPAAILLAVQGEWGKAVIMTVWGGLVVSLVDNLLYPVLVGKKMRLHTVPVFFAVVGGLFVFGASGLILGPVILAVATALVDVWRCRISERDTAELSNC